MNKDALLATGIGFLLGLVVTGVILFGPNLVKKIPSVNLPKIGFSINLPFFNSGKNSTTSNTAATKKGSPTSLTVLSPLPDSLAENDTLLVSGTAPTGSTVIIGGEIDEDIVTTTENGSFAGNITLQEGKNTVLITAINEKDMFEQSLTVYYTPEQF